MTRVGRREKETEPSAANSTADAARRHSRLREKKNIMRKGIAGESLRRKIVRVRRTAASETSVAAAAAAIRHTAHEAPAPWSRYWSHHVLLGRPRRRSRSPGTVASAAIPSTAPAASSIAITQRAENPTVKGDIRTRHPTPFFAKRSKHCSFPHDCHLST